jgi:hypothetical protein
MKFSTHSVTPDKWTNMEERVSGYGPKNCEILFFAQAFWIAWFHIARTSGFWIRSEQAQRRLPHH